MKISNIIPFIKVCISSLSCTVVDLGLFYLICHNQKGFIIITVATVISRVCSSILNFFINKYWAFKSDNKTSKEALLFFILFISKMLLSAYLVYLFSFIKIHQTILKAMVDFVLFFGSYIIQKKIIFKK